MKRLSEHRAMNLHHPVYPELVKGLPFSLLRYSTAQRKGQPFDKLRVDGGGGNYAKLQRAALALAALLLATAAAPATPFRDCPDCPEMVVIRSGSFVMGSSEIERQTLGVMAIFGPMESPRHKVRIRHQFAIGRYAVTFAEWDACVADGGCNGYRPDDNGWGRGRRPVINVDWADTQAYIAWLNAKTGQHYRLPSEAEWEYAGRAGTTTWYPFGNAIDPAQANYGNHSDRTAPVGSYPANRFALYDMTGNTAQWTQDCHHASYDGAPTDGSAWIAGGDCALRNVRGGAWSLAGWSVRVAQRIGDPAATRNNHLGFRVVRDLGR